MRVLVTAVVLALVAAACGDSADVATTTTFDGDLAATTTGAPPTTGAPTTTSPATTATAAPDTTPTTSTPGEGTVDDDSDTTLELNPIPPKPVPPVDVEIGEVDPAVMGFAEQARADLAQRLDVEESSIEIVTAELVVWPDSSLGCPQPDMAYLQVLSDGYRILLTHDDAIYAYHGGGSRLDPFPCEQPAKPVAGATPGSGGGDS